MCGGEQPERSPNGYGLGGLRDTFCMFLSTENGEEVLTLEHKNNENAVFLEMSYFDVLFMCIMDWIFSVSKMFP